MKSITSEQVTTARALIRWKQKDLTASSGIFLPSIKRVETSPRALAARGRTIDAISAALEAASVEFIAEHGGEAGMRLRKSSE